MIGWKKWKTPHLVKVKYEHTDVTYGIGKFVQQPDSSVVPAQISDETTIKCPKCGKKVERGRVVKRKYVCYECGGYFRVKTNNRIRMVADPHSFTPLFSESSPCNPLQFPDYEQKIRETRDKTGLDEAVTIGTCRVFGEEILLGVCDSRFLMGSMGSVVGEKIANAFEYATEKRLPVFLFCCSGGARMQEGIVSLMQMAKTSAAIKRHSDAGLFYCSILTDPTTGGVTASFAMLGDVILGEPGALIGFAGPRVIRQTIGQDLPEGFQTAEFLLQHGFLDGIVKRENLRKTIYFLVNAHHGKPSFYADFRQQEAEFSPSEVLRERQWKSMDLTAWDKVTGVRKMTRPSAFDYMEQIFDTFVEAHGDRAYGDDPSIVGGIGFLGRQPMTVIAQLKGKTPEECAARNYGMPMPEGYRKAVRLMKQAEKFHRPIVCFVNTPGAYPGVKAEERGIGESIARSLMEMSGLTVPVLSILIGEGGSGGALATAVGNEVWMLENATYSILSPEGFASILWKDSGRAKEASEVMKITAADLYGLHVIDRIIPEYGGADELSSPAIGKYLRQQICLFLDKFTGVEPKKIATMRYERFRRF